MRHAQIVVLFDKPAFDQFPRPDGDNVIHKISPHRVKPGVSKRYFHTLSQDEVPAQGTHKIRSQIAQGCPYYIERTDSAEIVFQFSQWDVAEPEDDKSYSDQAANCQKDFITRVHLAKSI